MHQKTYQKLNEKILKYECKVEQTLNKFFHIYL